MFIINSLLILCCNNEIKMVKIDILEKIENINFSPTKKVDLIWYDGPLLSYFIDNEKHYFCSWIDCDKNINRWVFHQITIKRLEQFIKNKINYQELLSEFNIVYIWDIGENFHEKEQYSITLEEYDKYYRHGENIMYKDGDYDYSLKTIIDKYL